MRILVVEDDKKIADFLKDSLKAECFAVDVAEDGEKGLFLALANDYDLIILDNVLPKKTGKEICKEIKERKKHVKIIILSVLVDVPTKVELLEIGADDYVSKPFSFNELLARIKALLRRPSNVNHHKELAIGDLVMDLSKFQVKKSGKEINLTKKEFMLLELLMKNNGAVVSRAMVMESIWDMNADPFSNTIETHIRNLRRKVESKNESIIKTVSGRGYKIESA